MKKLLALALLSASFLAGSAAHANGLPGQRLEKTVGNIIIDVGTDVVGQPLVGSPIQFDFAPVDAGSRLLIPFTDLLLTVRKGDAILFRGDLRAAAYGPTLFTYAFPEMGAYQIDTVFFDAKGQKVVEGTLPDMRFGRGLLAPENMPAAPPPSDLKAVADDASGMLHLRRGATSDQYVADIRTDLVTAPKSGRPVRFDLALRSNVGNAPVPVSDIEVAVSKDGLTYLDADLIAPAQGLPGMTYAFPEGGVFTISVAPFKGEKQITDATFSSVYVGSNGAPTAGKFSTQFAGPYAYVAAFCLIFLFVAFAFVKAFRDSKKNRHDPQDKK